MGSRESLRGLVLDALDDGVPLSTVARACGLSRMEIRRLAER